MSAHRHRATWRSITFNQVYVDTGLAPDDPANLAAAYQDSDYRLEHFEADRVTMQDYRELRQHLEGAEPNEAFEGVRVMTMRGHILAASHGELEDKTWAMEDAFSPASCRFDTSYPLDLGASTYKPANTIPFRFKVDRAAGGALAMVTFARPATGRPVIIRRIREGLSRAFIAQLVAFDSRIYEDSVTVAALTKNGTTALDLTGAPAYVHPQYRITMSAAGSASFQLQGPIGTLALDLSGLVAGNVVLIRAWDGAITDETGTINRYATRVSGFVTQLYLRGGQSNNVTTVNATGINTIAAEYRKGHS